MVKVVEYSILDENGNAVTLAGLDGIFVHKGQTLRIVSVSRDMCLGDVRDALTTKWQTTEEIADKLGCNVRNAREALQAYEGLFYLDTEKLGKKTVWKIPTKRDR